ncbi:hypothetical protein GCM10023115_12770 [Pontixanthobacter gangjinensis]|uniref:PilZ domain-containing protein n=1 Tax=Pontixanthobacter gangjinensis TaxID=1028742 RepID=A0A6I4SKV0_9SPHN|nr:hypothetical protein [Pontixanthobacter gangjinensis]MXO56521.1 hypothetical protein [Pontixanthobacter gangjinensis]
MTHSGQSRKVGYPKADLIVGDQAISISLVDVTISSVFAILPYGAGVSEGDVIAITMDDFPSAIATIKWVVGDRVGLEFRKAIHPSVVEYIARARAELMENCL